MKKYNKGRILSLVEGFTLIELLVVIAIIGILSSVVLSSLNTARDKGRNASAKSELASIRAQAVLYYDESNQSFGIDGTSCNNTTDLNIFNPSEPNNAANLITSAETHIGVPGSAACANSSSAYVVALPLIGGDNWCVDSTGYSGTTTLAIPAGVQSGIACQ
jgi:prepilin-type N-terminal cleavage/methylation domain